LSIDYEGYKTIGQAAESLKNEGFEIPIPTIRNWLNDLHDNKVHTIPRNERGERVLHKTDIEIVKFIYQVKKKYGQNVTMKTISESVLNNDTFFPHLAYDPGDPIEEGERTDLYGVTRMKEYFEDQTKQMREEFSSLRQQLLQEHNQRLALLPNPEEEKKERILEMRQLNLDRALLEQKVRRFLREQAQEAWTKDPKRIGFLFKKEDAVARHDFIEKYIDERYEQELRKNFDLQKDEPTK